MVHASWLDFWLQTLTNDANDKFTMLRVEVPDRPGLLTDLVQSLRCVLKAHGL